MSDADIVVATYPGFDSRDARTAGILRESGFEIRTMPRLVERTPSEVALFMAEATAGIVSTDPFDETVFAACPRLRVLARVGVGTDSIDLRAASAAGVAVTITSGVNVATVADHTLALMLACCRRLLENDVVLRDGGWERGGYLNGYELAGSTVGIIGLGAIGRAVARRLHGFEVDILGVDLPGIDCDGIPQVELDEVMARADIVTVHVPLSSSTKGLIGVRELALMRDGAILINTSRGGVVDEEALISALREGRLAGAGLDVFSREPPAGSPLLGMSNVVLSPHVAGISIHSQQVMIEMAVASIIDIIAGRYPPGLLNPDALTAAKGEVAGYEP